MLVGDGQRALQIEFTHRWNGVGAGSLAEAVDAITRAGRRGFDEAAQADDLIFQARHRGPRRIAVEIRVTSNGLLDVLNVNDAERAVRTPLPRLSTEKQSGDQC